MSGASLANPSILPPSIDLWLENQTGRIRPEKEEETSLNPTTSSLGQSIDGQTNTLSFQSPDSPSFENSEFSGTFTFGGTTTLTEEDSQQTVVTTQSVALPDLTAQITQIQLPELHQNGSEGKVQIRFLNQGDADVQGPITVNLYASTDTTITRDPETGELDLDALLLSKTKNGNLPAGESQTINFNYENIIVGPPGAYNLIVEVDVGDAVTESNEANNIETARVSAPGTDAVLDWGATFVNTLQVLETLEVEPPTGARGGAIVHSAMFDAVNLIEGQPFSSIFVDSLPSTLDAQNASPVAAVAGAAFTALNALYPSREATYLEQLESTLSEVEDGAFEDNGFAIGEFVATEILNLRANDGADEAQFELTDLPAIDSPEYVWRPTEPDQTPLLPGWGEVDPFAIPNLEDFLPGPAPAFGSPEYAEELEEVRRLGGQADTAVTTVERTDFQSETALFWLVDRAETSRPIGQWMQISQEQALLQDLPLLENARLQARLNIALADAGINSWDAKYNPRDPLTDPQPRPSTVINFIADNDGVEETVGDPDWEPLFPNPVFPDYTSGHATFGGAAAAVLSDAFGENFAFDATSQEIPGLTRSYSSFEEAATENTLSRVFAGVHVRSSGELGQAAGDAIGDFVAQNIAV